MSVQASTGRELTGDELSNVDEADVSFEGSTSVLHGEYHQSEGVIFSGLDEYSVTVTERDETYHVQVRDSDDKFIADSYVESENPYEELPENDSELHEAVMEADWED